MDRTDIIDWVMFALLIGAAITLVVTLTLHFTKPVPPAAPAADSTAYTRGLIEGARQATLKCPTEYKVLK